MSSLMQKIREFDAEKGVRSAICEIVQSGKQEEAFFVCDVGDIVRKHEIWTRSIPRVQPFYAVKCNDTPEVLSALSLLNVNFDCASKAEISKILGLGVSPDRIIFANPTKPVSDLKFAAENGVDLLTFDSSEELHKIKRYHGDANAVIRIRSDATISMCKLGAKFGCDSIEDALQVLIEAKSLGVRVVGVCFHVGSGCEEPEAFARAIKKARELFDKAKDVLGLNFTFLDIGGGYPGEKHTSIDDYARIINASLDEFFPDELNIKIIAEPGRFYVSSAFTLATQIIGMRREDDLIIYHINHGTYGSFSILAFSDLEPIIPIPLHAKTNSESHLTTFWGPTCDHYDLIVKNIMFQKMEIGDWVIFEDKGSYTLPLCTNFQGNEIPDVIYIANKETLEKFNNLIKLC